MRSPATHSAAVYDPATKKVLRLIVPDFAYQLRDPLTIAPHEHFVLVPWVGVDEMTHDQKLSYCANTIAEVEARL